MNVWRQHRAKLLWAGALSGGAYLAGLYAKRRFYEVQERGVQERNARDKRFDQNQQDCTFTVLALLPEISEAVLNELNVEKIALVLQQKKSSTTTTIADQKLSNGNLASTAEPGNVASNSQYDHMSKLELWNELKTINFTRIMLAMYSVALLSVFTRVQLNMIGRLIYLDSVAVINRHPDDKLASVDGRAGGFLDHKVEQLYLTFSWWFLNIGWRNCCIRVRDAVEKVVGGLSLKRIISPDDLSLLISEIRVRVEKEDFSSLNSLAFNFSQFLMPQEPQEAEVLRKGGAEVADTIDGRTDNNTLRDLLDETRDRLESPDFDTLLTSCMDSMCTLLLSHLTPMFHPTLPSETEAELFTPASKHLPLQFQSIALAALLPALKAEVHHVLNGVPNEYVAAVARVHKLKQYSLLVYTDYDVGELK